MKLRVILIILSLMAFTSASTGGFLYYRSLRDTTLREADRQALMRAETVRNHFSSFMSENLKSVQALAGLNEMQEALSVGNPESLVGANLLLDHFQSSLNVDVCYLMDRRGYTIGSSNRNSPGSFIGKNYAFRPYYKEAMGGKPTIYMALGVTSKKRGVYCSHPVYKQGQRLPIGVAVIKSSIDKIEREFSQSYEGFVMLTDPNGIVFVSNQREWLYQSLWRLVPEQASQIAASQQFGSGPWEWIGMKMTDRTHAVDQSGREYLFHQLGIENYPGWNIVFLRSVDAISKKVSVPLIKLAGSLILTICIFIGLLVFFLYRRASFNIAQRRAAEEALRESEETTRALLNAPTESALLLDTEGNILSLNDPAAEAFGKKIDDLLGSSAFEHFGPEVMERRGSYHKKVVQSGIPIRYEDERKGRCMDTNVYPVFDSKGHVVRVAIFSRDITEQKRAERALKFAQEELSRYSKDLERQVNERTKEISIILENTPAVVYVKNREYEYEMVNSRFEELFGIRNREIRGKTDYDIFPNEVADQFRSNDSKVLSEGRSYQAEEQVPQDDGVHIYLSAKFPLYGDEGRIHSLCGISTDITTIKRAQDQLRRLSSRIMESQEKERTAIARELHDELGQMLTALRMDSVWLREHLKGDEVKERARAMCGLIDKTIDEIRGMATRLRPGVLDDLGLIEALEWYTIEFEKRAGIACIYNNHRDMPPIKDTLATAAYRIAQEALTNVARHSFANNVEVTLQAEGQELKLLVVDNGGGFNTKKISESDCLGIAGMKERATLVGGELDIQSAPGMGTQVLFRAPLNGAILSGG